MAKARSTKRNPPARARKRVLVVTGSRSEFGLLRPVMDAVKKHRGLELLVVVAGEHLLKPALTVREVEKAYRVAARVPMQRAGDRGRVDHAAATARGMQGFASAFKKLKPDWVVVLGDRIEAFAAASAASIAGIAVCHIHGGDRAEGIADEAMRHAITKLSHLHCAATKLSAERIVKMGERAESVHVTGSPAIDGLKQVPVMSDGDFAALGNPLAVVLLHPSADPRVPDWKWGGVAAILASLIAAYTCTADARSGADRVLYLSPNHDPGSGDIRAVVKEANKTFGTRSIEHLPREQFIAMIKRLKKANGVLVGNSSSGLIEAASLGVQVLNLGPRQAGRERAGRVLDVEAYPTDNDVNQICDMVRTSRWPVGRKTPLFGDGRAGPRIAALLAKTNPHDPALLRKRNSY